MRDADRRASRAGSSRRTAASGASSPKPARTSRSFGHELPHRRGHEHDHVESLRQLRDRAAGEDALVVGVGVQEDDVASPLRGPVTGCAVRPRPADCWSAPEPMGHSRQAARRRQSRRSPRAAVDSLAAVGVHEDLEFSHKLADAADAITTARFQALDLRVDTKPDLTPASEADSAAEEAVRRLVRSSGRGEGVVGEELEEEVEDSPDRRPDRRQRTTSAACRSGRRYSLEREGRLQCARLGAAARPAVVGDARRRHVRQRQALRRLQDLARRGGVHFDGDERTTDRGAQGLIDRAWSAQSLGGFWQHCLVAEASSTACQPRPRCGTRRRRR